MLITPEDFLRCEIETQNLTLTNPQFVDLATSVAELVKTFKPTTVIDYGCGTGVYAEIMRQGGLNVYAMDIWAPHRDYCKTNYPDLHVIDIPIKADFMVWIEVAEHMTDDEILQALIDIAPQTILFSSTFQTTPNDEKWGHINIKQPEEWMELFSNLDYTFHSNPMTPTEWAIIFTKK